MANRDGPRGFIPATSPGGNVPCKLHRIDGDAATQWFIGDLIDTAAGDGAVNIATATAGNYVDGAVVGLYDDDMVPVSYLAVSTAGYALCTSDPNQLLMAQDDGDTTQLALIDEGTNVDMVATHGGSTVNYRSGMEIDSSSTAAGATGQLRLVDKVDVEGNAIGANCKWLVHLHYTHLGPVAGSEV